MKKLLRYLLVLCILFSLAITLFMQQKIFGKNPTGADLEKITASPNYRNGEFQNLLPTAVQPEDVSFWTILKGFYNKPQTVTPPTPLPTVRTDLKALVQKTTEAPQVVWFGHSSYFITYKGTTILIDPVFSGYASPISWFGKAFDGTSVYQPADFPPIDILVLTHDHYDHLDYETIVQLHPTVKKIYTPLGVGSHLKYWGVAAEKITEMDWWDKQVHHDSIHITAVPSRHFSGRGILRAKTLWAAFALKLYDYQLFLGGDSGYDEKNFQEIGEKFGDFDLAFLECGQYNDSWRYIHFAPEQTLQAAQAIRAKVLLPVHWGKFALAYHEWNEPIRRISQAAQQANFPITTPKIGEVVVIGKNYPNSVWW
jgi:L-ascorbate metabolism protein UlaG (beta-lactamase superfamily)